MEALFGYTFWDHVVLGVTFWAYDQHSIDVRNSNGKNESWWISGMNADLQERFHLDHDLEVITNNTIFT